MAVELLFLGELDIHARAFLPFLIRHGYNVTVVNTSHRAFPKKIEGTDVPVCNLYENSKIRFLFLGRLEWFRKAALCSLAEKTKDPWRQVKQIMKQEEIQMVYGSWGSHSLPEFKLMREFDVPLIYEFLTYPTNVFGFAEKIENIFNEGVVNGLNGRVLATDRMLRYLKNVFGIHQGENIVFAECYPEKFFYQRRLSCLSGTDGQPHLIFIGLDVYNIFPQIEEIIRREIHVHVCDEKGSSKKPSPKFKHLLHTFKKFDYNRLLNGTFATFMTQFDACLVTYDFQKASTLNRYYNSIPNRFSLALTAGIPIVMPRGYLKGCEEIANKHQIGFTYIDYDDLRNKLANDQLIDHYRRNAVFKSEEFTLENNFGKFDEFLGQILHEDRKQKVKS